MNISLSTVLTSVSGYSYLGGGEGGKEEEEEEEEEEDGSMASTINYL